MPLRSTFALSLLGLLAGGCFGGGDDSNTTVATLTTLSTNGDSTSGDGDGSPGDGDGTPGDGDGTPGDGDGTPGDGDGSPGLCGDGIVQGSEECDDGNPVNTDACTNECMNAACGDGFVQDGVEECDDGNTDDTDACLSTCMAATCGDGIVQVGVEQCDDGNMDDTDACVSGCANATCGDGFLQAGVEQCDDGNNVDNDACSNNCTNNISCAGVLFDPGNGIMGCWYTAPMVGMSCAQVCMNHGGFNSMASQHTGNAAGKMFWPNKTDGGVWQTVECSSTDNNTNWGANGMLPDPNYMFSFCYLNCACNQ